MNGGKQPTIEIATGFMWSIIVIQTPQLYRCRDPFGNLIAKSKGSVIINASDIMRESDIEAFNSNA